MQSKDEIISFLLGKIPKESLDKQSSVYILTV